MLATCELRVDGQHEHAGDLDAHGRVFHGQKPALFGLTKMGGASKRFWVCCWLAEQACGDQERGEELAERTNCTRGGELPDLDCLFYSTASRRQHSSLISLRVLEYHRSQSRAMPNVSSVRPRTRYMNNSL